MNDSVFEWLARSDSSDWRGVLRQLIEKQLRRDEPKLISPGMGLAPPWTDKM